MRSKQIKTVAGSKNALAAFAQLKTCTIIDFDDNLALSAADYSIACSLGMADAIIYATAKKNGAKIITSDAHFKGLEDAIFIE